jgi:hypothetical protein
MGPLVVSSRSCRKVQYEGPKLRIELHDLCCECTMTGIGNNVDVRMRTASPSVTSGIDRATKLKKTNPKENLSCFSNHNNKDSHAEKEKVNHRFP